MNKSIFDAEALWGKSFCLLAYAHIMKDNAQGAFKTPGNNLKLGAWIVCMFLT